MIGDCFLIASHKSAEGMSAYGIASAKIVNLRQLSVLYNKRHAFFEQTLHDRKKNNFVAIHIKEYP